MTEDMLCATLHVPRVFEPQVPIAGTCSLLSLWYRFFLSLSLCLTSLTLLFPNTPNPLLASRAFSQVSTSRTGCVQLALSSCSHSASISAWIVGAIIWNRQVDQAPGCGLGAQEEWVPMCTAPKPRFLASGWCGGGFCGDVGVKSGVNFWSPFPSDGDFCLCLRRVPVSWLVGAYPLRGDVLGGRPPRRWPRELTSFLSYLLTGSARLFQCFCVD